MFEHHQSRVNVVVIIVVCVMDVSVLWRWVNVCVWVCVSWMLFSVCVNKKQQSFMKGNSEYTCKMGTFTYIDLLVFRSVARMITQNVITQPRNHTYFILIFCCVFFCSFLISSLLLGFVVVLLYFMLQFFFQIFFQCSRPKSNSKRIYGSLLLLL